MIMKHSYSGLLRNHLANQQTGERALVLQTNAGSLRVSFANGSSPDPAEALKSFSRKLVTVFGERTGQNLVIDSSADIAVAVTKPRAPAAPEM